MHSIHTSSTIRSFQPSFPSRTITSLVDHCDSEFFKLDDNFDPINPNFYHTLAKRNERSEQQAVILLRLSKKSAIEIATLPFFEEACDEYTSSIIRALEEISLTGNRGEKKKACYALLKSCQNHALPKSIQQVAQIVLLQFLARMPVIEIAALPFPVEEFKEYEDQIVRALQQALFIKKNDEASREGMRKICCSLLKSYQNSELSKSTRRLAQEFLFQFLMRAVKNVSNKYLGDSNYLGESDFIGGSDSSDIDSSDIDSSDIDSSDVDSSDIDSSDVDSSDVDSSDVDSSDVDSSDADSSDADRYMDQKIIYLLKKYLFITTDSKKYFENKIESVEEQKSHGVSHKQKTLCKLERYNQKIESAHEDLLVMYSYLKGKVEKFDVQYLNETIEYCLDNTARRGAGYYEVRLVAHILINFSDDFSVIREAEALLMIVPSKSEHFLTNFLDHLNSAINQNMRPEIAFFLGTMFFNYGRLVAFPKQKNFDVRYLLHLDNKVMKQCDTKALEYFSLAARWGYAPLNGFPKFLAEKVPDLEVLVMLQDIVEEHEIVDYLNVKKIKIQSPKAEISIAMGFLSNDWHSTHDLQYIFKIGALCIGDTYKYIPKGIRILELLSKLNNYSIASKAQQILAIWLKDTGNSTHVIRKAVIEMYESQVNRPVLHILAQAQIHKNQGDRVIAQQLLHDLIDSAIYLETINGTQLMNKFCSSFYQLLLESPAVDDSYKYELKLRRAICDEEISLTDRDVFECLSHAANMKGRPYASYQIGKILYSNSSLSDLESGMAAKAYKNSKKYLEKAFNEECIFDVDEELKRLTQDLETVIYPAIIGLMNRRGGHRLEQADLDDMKKRFHVASKAGNREAKFNYLNLAISEKNQVDENRFKLGKLYLSGTTTSHPKKNVVEAQKLLESAARNGHVKAAVLVAQHYCSYTPHQPKFKSSDLIYQVIPENPNDIALEFLKIAVKSGLKKEKAKIAENKMPEYLIQIAKQLDPSAMEMVFSLSEQYEKIHFKTDDDVKLANFLYKMALDAQYPAALNKLRAQEQKLAKELAIKLQRKMNDLQTLEKSGL